MALQVEEKNKESATLIKLGALSIHGNMDFEIILVNIAL